MKRVVMTLVAFGLAMAPRQTLGQGVQVETLVATINANGDMAVGPDGKLYVADAFLERYVFGTPVGTEIFRVDPAGTVELFVDGLAGPTGLVFDPAGDLFASQQAGPNFSGNNVVRITPGGDVIRHVSLSLGHTGMAFASDGSLFVAHCGPAGQAVKRITPTRISTQFSNSGLLECPSGVAMDEDENLYVANLGNGAIIKIGGDGTATTLAQVPVAAAFMAYANEHLYVAAPSDHRIYQISLAGEVSVLAGTGQLGADDGAGATATFGWVFGLAASVTGDTLYVGDNAAGTQTTAHPNLIRMITGLHSAVATSSEDEAELPSAVALKQNYPNPFNPSTVVRFELARPGHVQLTVLDLLGRKVAVLIDGPMSAGLHEASFDAGSLPSGAYVYQMQSLGQVVSRTMHLVR